MRQPLLLILFLLTVKPCFPESPFVETRPEPARHSSFWKASVLALAAASAADMQTSMGRRELNPLLANAQGRFGTRGIAVKSLITGSGLGLQWLLLHRRSGAERYAAIANFGAASVLGTAAVRNRAIR